VARSASEAALWRRLRGRRLGVQFRRQVVLGSFVVDFLAPSARLVVEVDGGWHAGRDAADARRVEREVEVAVARVRDALGGA